MTECLGNSANTIQKIVGLVPEVRDLFPLIVGDLYRRVHDSESLSNMCSVLGWLMNYAFKFTYIDRNMKEGHI